MYTCKDNLTPLLYSGKKKATITLKFFYNMIPQHVHPLESYGGIMKSGCWIPPPVHFLPEKPRISISNTFPGHADAVGIRRTL